MKNQSCSRNFLKSHNRNHFQLPLPIRILKKIVIVLQPPRLAIRIPLSRTERFSLHLTPTTRKHSDTTSVTSILIPRSTTTTVPKNMSANAGLYGSRRKTQELGGQVEEKRYPLSASPIVAEVSRGQGDRKTTVSVQGLLVYIPDHILNPPTTMSFGVELYFGVPDKREDFFADVEEEYWLQINCRSFQNGSHTFVKLKGGKHTMPKNTRALTIIDLDEAPLDMEYIRKYLLQFLGACLSKKAETQAGWDAVEMNDEATEVKVSRSPGGRRSFVDIFTVNLDERGTAPAAAPAVHVGAGSAVQRAAAKPKTPFRKGAGKGSAPRSTAAAAGAASSQQLPPAATSPPEDALTADIVAEAMSLTFPSWFSDLKTPAPDLEKIKQEWLSQQDVQYTPPPEKPLQLELADADVMQQGPSAKTHSIGTAALQPHPAKAAASSDNAVTADVVAEALSLTFPQWFSELKIPSPDLEKIKQKWLAQQGVTVQFTPPVEIVDVETTEEEVDATQDARKGKGKKGASTKTASSSNKTPAAKAPATSTAMKTAVKKTAMKTAAAAKSPAKKTVPMKKKK